MIFWPKPKREHTSELRNANLRVFQGYSSSRKIRQDKSIMENPQQEPLDYDLAMRTVMYFGLEMTREEAFNRVGVLLSQEESFDSLWDELEQQKGSN